MALGQYQEVFCNMVASPAYRKRVLEQPDQELAGLDLTDRERHRLLTIAAQRGMQVNTALHRANRLSPLDHTLPFTCFLLAERMGEVVGRYWSENPTENLQLPVECERFAAFLKRELQAGRLQDPYIEEVLEFERVCTELKLLTDGELAQSLSPTGGLPPGVRVITFRHDPVALLNALMNFRPPPTDIVAGEFNLMIDCRSGEPDFRLVDSECLALLSTLDSASQD